jgi:hypothetical protein
MQPSAGKTPSEMIEGRVFFATYPGVRYDRRQLQEEMPR